MTRAQIVLLIVGSVFAAAAMVSLYMAGYVLQHAPQPRATQGMFGFCTLAAFTGMGAFFCGYRFNHGEWP